MSLRMPRSGYRVNSGSVPMCTICASGAHFLRVMPKPGHRATTYVAPNIIFKGGRAFGPNRSNIHF